MDLIEQALARRLAEHPNGAPGLWLVDENLPLLTSVQLPEGVELVTNRFDIFVRARQRGWPVHFSDFDLSAWAEQSLARIYYRVSKEKALVHHLLNQGARLLQSGARLWLFGGKQEGTKTYFDKARKYFGDGRLGKLGKGGFEGELLVSEPLGSALDDRGYAEPRPIVEGFISKPGLFGWDKLDQGSALLAQQFDSIWARLDNDHPQVLDLGCGYGYLSVKAFEQGVGEITATDNNAAAVSMCRSNFERLAIPGEVCADDCANSIQQRFDLVLCNPPFHQGFAVEGELTDRFISSAARLCKPEGLAAFVVNRFIPLERKAADQFGSVETLLDDGSFKLVCLSRPHRSL